MHAAITTCPSRLLDEHPKEQQNVMPLQGNATTR